MLKLTGSHTHVREPWWGVGEVGVSVWVESGGLRGVHGHLHGRRGCAVLPLAPVLDLVHPAYSPAAQFRVLVAVPPAVDGPLYQSSLLLQDWVELRKRPADCVALGLVLQSVALVLLLVDVGAGVDTVC